MSNFFKRLLGFILLLSTMGLATCQSLVKAEPGRELKHRSEPPNPGRS